MKRNIFCKFCHFYGNDPKFKYPPDKNTGTDVHTFCTCIQNIDPKLPKHDPRRYRSCPSIINRNHDCNWFKIKEDLNTYVWSHDKKVPPAYKGNDPGTYSINPVNGVEGFYIGDKNLKEILDDATGGGSEEIQKLKMTVEDHSNSIEQLNNNIEIYNTEITNIKDDITELQQQIDVETVLENKGIEGGSSTQVL